MPDSKLSQRSAGRVLQLAFVAATACAGPAQAALMTVTPTAMGDWTLYSTDSSGALNTGSATAELVNGPATPPYGTGSAHLQTGAGAGDGSAQLRTTGWAGTRIDSLTSLSYSTYATAWNGAQLPYLTIWLDTDNNGSRDDRLWFEPTYSSAGAGNGNPSPQPAVALNQWQTWDALGGMWYSDNEAGPGSNAITLGAYLALRPDATIVNAAPGVGGIRIAAGFASAGDDFNTYVDGFTIGTLAGSTTYNFELVDGAAVPEPAAIGLAGLALAALGLGRRRRNV